MAASGWRKNKKGYLVNSEGKTRRRVLAEKNQAAKKERNKIVAFDRPTEEKRRKKQQKKAIKIERTLLENQAVRDKAKNDKVSMDRQALGLTQNSRQALNRHSLDGKPFEVNRVSKTGKPLGISKAEKKRIAENQISNFKRKKKG
ncbi:MAG: hypothetical protein GPJ00_05400 [Microcystis aeruginosa W13-18]|nr:hypothetical protein [Microcystis aeruginosa W13-18]NCR35166.1 hypothetical protein [Microcystis aeruginosa S11-05]NCR48683.1 hypothetical protein [Microcystis aeruginosa S11-01]